MSIEADLLVRGARVWTDGSTRAGVDAVAVARGRVAALGREPELAGLVAPRTLVLDAGGATVTPGLTDAHIHFVQWARALDELDLGGFATPEDVAARVARIVASDPRRDPIVGRGWDGNRFGSPPERQVLDRVSEGRAVLLHAKDAHALWVNGEALARCGIRRETADPPGGRIVRDASGEPTGLLQEHAVALCASLLDAGGRTDLAQVAASAERLHALGVTGVHDFEGAGAQRVLRTLCAASPLPLRVLMHLPHSGLDAALTLGLASGTGDDRFRIGAVKLFADGTLGSRTAAMLDPYEGTGERGMELLPPAEIAELVRRAFEGGLSIAIHAIGDRAARSALDAFERSAHLIPGLALPPRIEHLQLVAPEDQPRLAALGVGASMQPLHAVSDAELAERHWGARVAHSYPWRSLGSGGGVLAFGSDAPVEPPSVAAGLHAALTRSVPGRARPFAPEQCLTLDEALTAYTQGPARLAGVWPRLGTLRPGSAGDLVVWDRDLHRIPARELAEVAPVATVIDGTVVWRRAPAATSSRAAASQASRAPAATATGGRA